jgi:nucleoside-diphosphate-sugar epimerase
VVHGNLLAAAAPDAVGETMNLATGGSVTLLQLVHKLNALLGTELEPIYADIRTGDILHSRAGIEKAAALLDYAPIVNFDEGLARTVAFYRQLTAEADAD